jgi:hypothetical protein
VVNGKMLRIIKFPFIKAPLHVILCRQTTERERGRPTLNPECWQPPFKGQRKEILMRRVLITALATAAIGLGTATPAFAGTTPADANGVTVTQPDTGTPLTDQIYGITNATPATTQYGTEPSNGGTANVTFTGNTAFTIDNGFAQLITGSSSLTSLTINPDDLFSAMQLAFSLTGLNGGQSAPVSVSYVLADGVTTGTLADIVTGSGNNDNFEVDISGGLFDSITITSAEHGFAAVKQVSINDVDGAVPEPATWGMMLLGFAGIGMAMRRSRRRNGALMQVA